MSKIYHWDPASNDPVDEVETMVRAAGQYVHASDDLRPRVLEAARTLCGEQRAQRCIRQAATFVVLVALFATTGRQFDSVASSPHGSWAIDAQSLMTRAEATAAANGDFGWGMVDAFTELRRRQAAVLRLTL